MTLAEKIEALCGAGFPIRYADRASWHIGYSLNAIGHWTFYDRCPRYVSYSEVHNAPEIMTRTYADLTDIGRSEDQAGQSTTLDRSNFRSLQRDYPDVFTPLRWSNVDGLGAYAGNLPEDVVTLLCGLKTDYPVYDESDMSELESEEVTDSWEQYVRLDLPSELPESARDAWEALTDDEQRARFWQACGASDYYPEHDGFDVCWRYEQILPALVTALCES